MQNVKLEYQCAYWKALTRERLILWATISLAEVSRFLKYELNIERTVLS